MLGMLHCRISGPANGIPSHFNLWLRAKMKVFITKVSLQTLHLYISICYAYISIQLYTMTRLLYATTTQTTTSKIPSFNYWLKKHHQVIYHYSENNAHIQQHAHRYCCSQCRQTYEKKNHTDFSLGCHRVRHLRLGELLTETEMPSGILPVTSKTQI